MGISSIVLLLALAPYAVAYAGISQGNAFSGFLHNLQDGNQYMAAIRQGMEGSWLYHDRFTSEPHQAGPLYLFYLALGQAARLLHLSQHAVYFVGWLICNLVLLGTAYWFLTLLLPECRQRRTAFLLLCFSSGLGWLWLLTTEAVTFSEAPIDLWVAEAITFFTLLTMPHFALATSLILGALGGLLSASHSDRWTPAVGAALACFALSWVHPFSLAIVFAVIGTYLAWQAMLWRKIPRQQLGKFALSLVASLPVLLYLQFVVIQPNPVFHGWIKQSATPSPSPLKYFWGYGLILLLAPIGGWQTIRNREQFDPLPLCWAGAGTILLYAPIAMQRRFLEGMHIPLCVLAALGWLSIAETLRTRRKLVRISLKALLFTGLVASNVAVWLSFMFIAAGQFSPYFLRDYEVEAVMWLTAKTEPEDTTLSSHQTGNLIPAWAGNRVVLGHWAQTVRFPEKKKAVQQLFDAETATELRQAILQRYGVVYLYHGPNEREIGGYAPSRDPIWEPVFSNTEITIYRSTLSR